MLCHWYDDNCFRNDIQCNGVLQSLNSFTTRSKLIINKSDKPPCYQKKVGTPQTDIITFH